MYRSSPGETNVTYAADGRQRHAGRGRGGQRRRWTLGADGGEPRFRVSGHVAAGAVVGAAAAAGRDSGRRHALTSGDGAVHTEPISTTCTAGRRMDAETTPLDPRRRRRRGWGRRCCWSRRPTGRNLDPADQRLLRLRRVSQRPHAHYGRRARQRRDAHARRPGDRRRRGDRQLLGAGGRGRHADPGPGRPPGRRVQAPDDSTPTPPGRPSPDCATVPGSSTSCGR